MLFLFTLTELCHILGVTPLELFVSAVSWLVFSILVCVKLEKWMELTWTNVFIPLFSALAVQLYLSTIVFIRRLRLRTQRGTKLGVILPKYIYSVFSVVVFLSTYVVLILSLNDSHNDSGKYVKAFISYLFWLGTSALLYCIGCTRQATFSRETLNG